MADNTDDLVISISTDTTAIKRALTKLVGDIDTASSQINRKFDSVGKGIDKSMTTALQSRINEMVNVGVQGAKQWAGALNDQGRQLDTLRGKYNPLFATIKSYKDAVSDIRTLYQSGAIGVDEYSAALSRERQATLASIAAIKAKASAQSEAAKAADAAAVVAYGIELDRLKAKFNPLIAAQQKYISSLGEIANAERMGAVSASQAVEARAKETASYNAQISRINDVAAAKKRAAEAIVGNRTVAPDRGADIAAYGKQLDVLRAKYNPLFATITQYKANLSELRQAYAIGAIGSEEFAAAQTKERQATLASIAALKGRANVPDPQHRNNGNGFQTANIAAQFQDIGVTAAMGMNPLQIALQQGTQLSAALGSAGGLAGSAKALAAGFAAIVSPVSIVTVGLVAGAAALIEYAANGTDNIPKVDDILKTHQANIEKLGPAYKEALEQQQKYIRDTPALAAGKASDLFKDANKRNLADAKAAFALVRGLQSGEATRSSSDFGGSDGTSRLDSATKAINDLQASIKAGAPKVREFRAEISELEQSGQLTPDLAKKLRDVTKSAEETQDSIGTISKSANALAASFQTASDQMANLPFGEMRTKIEALVSDFKQGKISAGEFEAQAKVLEQSYPTYSGWIESLSGIIEKLGAARSAAADLAGYVNVGADLKKGGRNPAMDALNARLGSVPQDENFFKRSGGAMDLADKLKAQKTSYESDHKVKKAPAIKKTASDRANDDIQAIKDRTAALTQEIGLVGLSYEEQTKRRTSLELEQKALKELRDEALRKGQTDLDSIKLSPDRIAAIEKESAAYAAQSQALRMVQENHEKAQAAASEFYNTFKSDTIDALTGAKSFSDALGDIAKKLGDMILNQAFDNLFKPATDSSAGGSAGGIFQSIGKMLSFDSGGYTGPGGKYQPAGIVHKGEYVFDAETTRRIGVENLARLRGYSAGGLVGGPQMPAVAARRGSDNSAFTYSPVIDARGADVAAVARLEQAMVRNQQDFSAKVLTTMRKAGKTGNWKGA